MNIEVQKEYGYVLLVGLALYLTQQLILLIPVLKMRSQTKIKAPTLYPRDSEIKELELKTEDVDLDFSDDGIDMLAKLSTEINSTVENIGARRLHTIIEKVLDEISFTATDRSGEKIEINSEYVKKNLGNLVKDTDLSKFIL